MLPVRLLTSNMHSDLNISTYDDVDDCQMVK